MKKKIIRSVLLLLLFLTPAYLQAAGEEVIKKITIPAQEAPSQDSYSTPIKYIEKGGFMLFPVNQISPKDNQVRQKILSQEEVPAQDAATPAQATPVIQQASSEVVVGFKDNTNPSQTLAETNIAYQEIKRVFPIVQAVRQFKKENRLEKDSDNWYWFFGKKYQEVTEEEIFSEAYKKMSPEEQRVYRIYKITIPEGSSVEEAVAALKNSSAVEFAQPNYQMKGSFTPNDPFYSSYGLLGPFDDLYGLKKIQCATAWDTSKGDNVLVAVVDTGSALSHPDLQNNLWTNADEISGNGIDDDANGYIDDVHGYDFAYRDGNPTDSQGHGTHVSGTIAAVGNNNYEVVGVAFNAKIMVCKGLGDDGAGYITDLAEGIHYAADNGARIINNSWGPEDRLATDPVAEAAVDYAYAKGCIITFAAGNNNDDVAYYSPANYSKVIAVSGTNYNDARYADSNWGDAIWVSAPGESILSLATDENYLASASGTSMACPHVSGVAALMLATKPALTDAEIKWLMRFSADDLGAAGKDSYFGYGRINAARAVTAAADNSAPATAVVTDEGATTSNQNQLSASWVSSDAQSGIIDYQYKITQDSTDGEVIVDWTSTGTTASVTSGSLSLVKGTTYYFSVKAKNGVGIWSNVGYSDGITEVSNNNAPVASNQSVTTDEDVPAGITLNATDVDGDNLTYALVTNPSHGALSGTAPNLNYVPNANYNGADSFTFKANDGLADSNIATVSITVTAINDPPVASDLLVTVLEDTPKAITLSATDADGDNLTYSVVTNPKHGTLSGTAPNLAYTPDAKFKGNDSFTYKANDGQVDSNTATVSINIQHVNHAPVAHHQSVNTDEDAAVNITLSATDADDDSLTYSVVTSPGYGSLSGTAPNLTYTPNESSYGDDSFTFKANDGLVNSNVATVSIKVKHVNHAPVAHDQSVNIRQDTPKAITLKATDKDKDSLTYTVLANPTQGSLSGVAPNLTYTPNTGYIGDDSFTFKANDGQLDSDAATVSLHVKLPPKAKISVVTPAPTTGSAVTFSSSNTEIGSGDIVTYNWNFGDGSSSAVANPSHTFQNSPWWQDKTYQVTLTVTDSNGVNDTTSGTVNVSKLIGPWR
ncbi:MAG: Ig-like domain-containing protein [Candidatus Omnitrophica bacterium]|nr:Ig-like domain-containing protein [Candidatus Omnitrophota bacterium]